MPTLLHKNAPEYGDRVNLIKKIKVGTAWRFAPVVPEPNGRLKDKVRINGAVEVHTEGAYYIEWYERGKRCRESSTREEAINHARRKSVELRTVREGLIAGPAPEPEAEVKTPIAIAIDEYLRLVKMHRKPRTHLTYRFTLDTLLRALLQAEVCRGRDAPGCPRLHDVLLRAGTRQTHRV